jgi:tetratricopeptide (TPR) repeat protein
MSKTTIFRAGAFAVFLSLSAAGALLLAVPGDAVAQQSKNGWREELANKAKDAQAAGQKGNYSEAIRLLKEAKAKAPLSPQEEQGINELLIWAASASKDYKLVIDTVDERIATGRVSGADLTRKLRLKATTQYSLRDYRGAAATFEKLAAQGALTADDLTLLATSQMQLKDYAHAPGTIEKAIAANSKAGRGAKNVPLYKMLNSIYFDTKNDPKRKETLIRMMAAAPSTDVFKQLAEVFEKDYVKDPVVMINTYRLGAQKGLLSGDQFGKYAETALDLSSPGEAVAMLEKGMAAGAIKKDDRNNRILADAKSQVERLKSSIAQQEKEAVATKNGENETRLATGFYSLKNYAKAAEAAQRAVTEGNSRRPDDAAMLLGVALANQKKSAEAKKAFAAAAATNGGKSKDIANLWASVTG